MSKRQNQENQKGPESPVLPTHPRTGAANAPPPLWHTAFYKFAPLRDPQDVAEALRGLASGLLGSVLVAPEGVNGMLSGSSEQLDAFAFALENDVRFDGALGGIKHKRTACKTTPFARLKIHLKKEIVPLGIDGVEASKQTGTNVSPKEWRKLIKQSDVVLLDNRNSFEYRMGRFANAIDPGVTNFRDFPNYVLAHLQQWKQEGKKVAMYCTGGIRCEKTSSWMADMGVPVYQLEGGILNYFAEMPDAEQDWQGDCFVFDNRVALDTQLNESGASLDDVYCADPEDQWRLARAKRLAAQS